MARVYIETTIPSFYFETRTGADMIARRDWTREWWALASGRDELVTSPAVIAELERGNFPGKSAALDLISSLPVLEITNLVMDVVEEYIERHLMPADPGGDALHLALASHHRCDFLVTWNCAHLANARKFGQIRQVNGILEISVPSVVTPLELLGEEEKP